MENYWRIFLVKKLNIGFLSFLFLFPYKFSSQTEQKIQRFFIGTNQQVDVYFISGKKKGPTLLIFAGIHGDESAGYLTCERYVDLKVKKGNLIIVPRLNLPAILSNRRNGITGDMNRLFHFPEKIENNSDMKVVNLAKYLITKSDCVLNLHQGKGFYSPVWINRERNPLKWGQSNIIDAPVFDLPNGEKLELEKFAEKIVSKINSKIKDEKYCFHINNTNTGSKNSIHKEQRKSLTYYAVTKQHKMAFGLEATKDCSLPLAISFLTIAVNSVIEEIGIVVDKLPSEDPNFIEKEIKEKEKFEGIIVKINDTEKFIYPHRNIFLKENDKFEVLNVKTSDQKGWYIHGDIPIFYNGYGRTIQFKENDTLTIQKDNKKISSINVIVCPFLLEKLEVSIGDKVYYFQNQETIYLKPNEKIKFLKVYPADKTVKVNLKGFIGNKEYNDGQDLGYEIKKESLIPKYALDKEKTLYKIELTYKKNIIGELFLKINNS